MEALGLPPSDEQLMAMAQAGNDDAFEELARRLEPRLYGFLLRRLNHRETVEDLVQEALLKAYRHRQQFKAGSRVSTWVFAMALNLLRDHFRQRKALGSLDDAATLALAERSRWIHRFPDPESQAESHELAGLLIDAVSDLPPLAQRVLDERIDGRETFDQVAQSLGVSPTAARSAASRAYRRLKDLIERKDVEGRHSAGKP